MPHLRFWSWDRDLSFSLRDACSLRDRHLHHEGLALAQPWRYQHLEVLPVGARNCELAPRLRARGNRDRHLKCTATTAHDAGAALAAPDPDPWPHGGHRPRRNGPAADALVRHGIVDLGVAICRGRGRLRLLSRRQGSSAEDGAKGGSERLGHGGGARHCGTALACELRRHCRPRRLRAHIAAALQQHRRSRGRHRRRDLVLIPHLVVAAPRLLRPLLPHLLQKLPGFPLARGLLAVAPSQLRTELLQFERPLGLLGPQALSFGLGLRQAPSQGRCSLLRLRRGGSCCCLLCHLLCRLPCMRCLAVMSARRGRAPIMPDGGRDGERKESEEEREDWRDILQEADNCAHRRHARIHGTGRGAAGWMPGRSS
mmetsp:Transcript_132956/g.296478  ORF Transcript_132956/g.296478 Transcript_132956/m.296478 type:complete len:370 (-) Transcript_132956:10-1119(-)